MSLESSFFCFSAFSHVFFGTEAAGKDVAEGNCFVSFLVYQIGTLIVSGSLGEAFAPGLVAVLCMLAIVVALIINTDRKLKAEYALKAEAKQKAAAK